MRPFPRRSLGADKGERPAGDQADSQEEDAAGSIGDALKSG
jgi:hypothetical protein